MTEERDDITAAAYEYTSAHARWQDARAYLREAIGRHARTQKEHDDALALASNAKIVLIELVRKAYDPHP